MDRGGGHVKHNRSWIRTLILLNQKVHNYGQLFMFDLSCEDAYSDGGTVADISQHDELGPVLLSFDHFYLLFYFEVR